MNNFKLDINSYVYSAIGYLAVELKKDIDINVSDVIYATDGKGVKLVAIDTPPRVIITKNDWTFSIEKEFFEKEYNNDTPIGITVNNIKQMLDNSYCSQLWK